MRISRQEREEFVAYVVGHASGDAARDGVVFHYSDALALAREAMRIACASQRWAETECSRYVGDGEKARGDKADARRDARMAEIARELGMTLEVQGDPRGSIYRLDGRAVPSVGWSARVLEMQSAERCERRKVRGQAQEGKA